MTDLIFKTVKTLVGGEVAGYMEEKTYECGSWIIGRNGKYVNMGYDNEVFIHWAGDWFVQRNDEIYGDFKTLKRAKQYIANWVKINPSDV